MNRFPSIASRRALLAASLLVLALSLAAGFRATNLGAALGWYGEPACDDLEAQNPGDPNGCRYSAKENQLEGAGGLAVCADDQDNDSDERTDCADPDCFGEANCGQGEWCNVESAEFAGQSGACGGDNGVNNCADGVDNDSDGLDDCADPDCAYGQGTWSSVCVHSDPTCAEYTCNAGSIGQDEWSCGGSCAAEKCFDGEDNDGSGGVDCADPSCANQDVCQNQIQTENDSTSCQDGQDNDGDTAVDCDDPDCAYDQSGTCWWAYAAFNPANWWPSNETDCGNGTDDDNDGYYDCADSVDCSADYRCAINNPGPVSTETSPWGYYDEYFCQNGGDDDYDGSVDCADPDCSGTAACAPRPCSATEQDADGNCVADYPYWGPSCDDGYDNDGDGNGADTNGNGQIDRGDAGVDCDDEDCRYDAACTDGGKGGAVNEIQPDGYPVAWNWGNGYCVDGIDGDQNGWTDCWDDLCDGQDLVCNTFTGLGTEGWPYDYRYDGGDPRNGGNRHAPGQGGIPTVEWCGNGVCESGESCEADCGATVDWCGDGYCDEASGEYAASCPQDCGGVSCEDSTACNYGQIGACDYDSCADPLGGAPRGDECGDGVRSKDEECDGPVENGRCNSYCGVECDPGYSSQKTISPFDGQKRFCSAFVINGDNRESDCGAATGTCLNGHKPTNVRREGDYLLWECGVDNCSGYIQDSF